ESEDDDDDQEPADPVEDEAPVRISGERERAGARRERAKKPRRDATAIARVEESETGGVSAVWWLLAAVALLALLFGLGVL
ncbi:MAG: hypothetical protein KC731_09880, partial [Myxococcales bacterium]|nr:hypothetical protein [Myxococcales bacterium]